MLVYVIAGGTAGIGGISYAAIYTTVLPAQGQGFELYAIAAAVIGGTSLAGGIGTIWGSMIGVFIMSVLSTGLPGPWPPGALADLLHRRHCHRGRAPGHVPQQDGRRGADRDPRGCLQVVHGGQDRRHEAGSGLDPGRPATASRRPRLREQNRGGPFRGEDDLPPHEGGAEGGAGPHQAPKRRPPITSLRRRSSGGIFCTRRKRRAASAGLMRGLQTGNSPERMSGAYSQRRYQYVGTKRRAACRSCRASHCFRPSRLLPAGPARSREPGREDLHPDGLQGLPVPVLADGHEGRPGRGGEVRR